MKRTVIDGVEVIEDDNGNMHFSTLENDSMEKHVIHADEDRNWLQRVIDWFKSDSAAYVKIGDRADPNFNRRQTPEDRDAGSDGAASVEIGWKWKF